MLEERLNEIVWRVVDPVASSSPGVSRIDGFSCLIKDRLDISAVLRILNQTLRR